VLEVATENAQRMGVGDRYSTLPGSAFDVEFGTGYDIVLMTGFLHHFDHSGCIILLKKVHGALADEGKAVTVDFVLNDDRISPPSAATFGLTMLATTPKGDAHTFREYEEMFQNAGFSRSELRQLPGDFMQVIISER
jgi:cyclopropane fatty-acyl-phospholipid synthase-like methyltransferase